MGPVRPGFDAHPPHLGNVLIEPVQAAAPGGPAIKVSNEGKYRALRERPRQGRARPPTCSPGRGGRLHLAEALRQQGGGGALHRLGADRDDRGGADSWGDPLQLVDVVQDAPRDADGQDC